MTTTNGQEVNSNGSKRSGIYDSITLESSKFSALGPFSDICPLLKVAPPMETLSPFFVSTRAQFIPNRG